MISVEGDESMEDFKEIALNLDLESIIKPKLDNDQFTDAIKDSFLYLTDLIRVTSGIEGGDGSILINKAFSAQQPLIKINDLSTETERSMQEGIRFLLSGMYSLYRNPRNHDVHHRDSKEEAYRIIIMIDSMAKWIISSRNQFSFDSIEIVLLDEFFTYTSEYADQISSGIPDNKRFDTIKKLLLKVDEIEIRRIKLIYNAILKDLDSSRKEEIAKFISEQIRTSDESEVVKYIGFVHVDMWNLLTPEVKLRTENMIISRLSSAKYDAGNFTEGLALIGARYTPEFSMKDALKRAIIDRLSKDWFTQNYIGRFYFSYLPKIFLSEEDIKGITDWLVYAAASNNAREVKKALIEGIPDLSQIWKIHLNEAAEERRFSDKTFCNKIIELTS